VLVLKLVPGRVGRAAGTTKSTNSMVATNALGVHAKLYVNGDERNVITDRDEIGTDVASGGGVG